MSAPTQNISINDPGLGNVEPAVTTFMVMGRCSSGTADTVTSVSSINTLVSTFGQGPAVEAAAKILQIAGGPVLMLRTQTSVAGSLSAVVQSGAGPLITLSGTANDDYAGLVTIVAGGILGAGTFTYSLDGGTTTSETLTIPGGGSFPVPDAGFTITFPSGTYVAAETYTFTTVTPFYNASDLTAAFTAVLADTTEFAAIVMAGTAADAATAATLFSAIDGHLTSLENGFRYVRAMMSTGADTAANAKSSFASSTSDRISPVFGTGRLASAKPIVGWASGSVPLVHHAGPHAAKALISTDLARVLSGPVQGTESISHDEFLNDQGLDDARISTFRTFPARAGFFITNMRLKSASGSDFRYWQHGRVIDVACRQTFLAQQELLSKAIRVTATGSIDEREAADIEADITGDLNSLLLSPLNAEGNPGHVSELSYTVDRTNDVLATEEVKSSVAIRPLGYPKIITTDIGYAKAV